MTRTEDAENRRQERRVTDIVRRANEAEIDWREAFVSAATSTPTPTPTPTSEDTRCTCVPSIFISSLKTFTNQLPNNAKPR